MVLPSLELKRSSLRCAYCRVFEPFVRGMFNVLDAVQSEVKVSEDIAKRIERLDYGCLKQCAELYVKYRCFFSVFLLRLHIDDSIEFSILMSALLDAIADILDMYATIARWIRDNAELVYDNIHVPSVACSCKLARYHEILLRETESLSTKMREGASSFFQSAVINCMYPGGIPPTLRQKAIADLWHKLIE